MRAQTAKASLQKAASWLIAQHLLSGLNKGMRKLMKRSLLTTKTTISSDRPSEAGTRLSGRLLVLARVAWISLVLLLLGIYAFLLPSYFELLQSICTGAACALVQPAPQTAQAIQQLGLSITSYALISLVLIILTMAACLIISIVIFWNKSDDWMALLTAFYLVSFGMLYVTDVLQESHSAWRLLAIGMNILDNAVFFLIASLFPNGRFIPRWTRWLIIGWILWGIVFILLRDLPYAYLVDRLVWIGLSACLIGAQFYRYRYVSSPIERQQTKWPVFAASIIGIALLGLTVPGLIFPALGQSGSLYQLAIGPVYPFGVLLISLSVGIAILRYRLWDIDILINRTMVYGTLTGLLILVYVGLVIGLQFLLHGLTGGSALSIVASTLVIAALFQPLRKRIQAIIDHRFYRRKYDAARTIAAFSATLRNEVDLNQLREHLLNVVQETMQPAHVSLWLREPIRTENQPRQAGNPHL
jgi:hypothetical protein